MKSPLLMTVFPVQQISFRELCKLYRHVLKYMGASGSPVLTVYEIFI